MGPLQMDEKKWVSGIITPKNGLINGYLWLYKPNYRALKLVKGPMLWTLENFQHIRLISMAGGVTLFRTLVHQNDEKPTQHSVEDCPNVTKSKMI